MRTCLTMTMAGWVGERGPLEPLTLTSHMTHQDIKVISKINGVPAPRI